MLKSKKTNSPVVVECKNSWEIRVNVYLGKGVPRQQRHSTGYTSESIALLHAPYFRHAVESSVRGKYPSWWYDKENLDKIKLPVYSDVCCSYGENKLSAAESVSFNAFQKRKRVMNEKEEFSMLKSMWKGKFSGSYTSADARDRYCRSLVRRANRHRMSSRVTAPNRSIEKRIIELNIRVKLLELRITENKKRVIKLYCTPSKDFIRPATISTEWADNIEGGLVVDPIAVEIIDGLGAYTEVKINRVQTKVLLCREMLGSIIKRDAEELQLLSNYDRVNIRKVSDEIWTLRQEQNKPMLASNILERLEVNVTTTLLLKWPNEYLRDGGFRVSSRGCYKRDSFLVMHGLFPRFKLLMKTDKNVCVNSCQIYLQDVVIKEDLVDELTKFGLIYPLPSSTVHG